MPKADYEPIPDVEEGNRERELTPREKYPEANEKQTDLLVFLDQCIENPVSEVNLPHVPASDIELHSFTYIFALTVPTIVALAMLGTAFYVGAGHAPAYVDFCFPYLAALSVFLASVIPIHDRIMKQGLIVLSDLETIEEMGLGSIDNVGKHVETKVDLAQKKIKVVVDAMRPKIIEATTLQSHLNELDPDVKVSDPTEIEHELDGAIDDIRTSVNSLKNSFQVQSLIPTYLRSVQSFECRIVYPVFILCLVLQLVGAFVITLLSPTDLEDESLVRTMTMDQQVRFQLGSHPEIVEFESFQERETSDDLIETSWPFILSVLEIYIMALVQLASVYFATRAATIAFAINESRQSVSDALNADIRVHGVAAMCDDILVHRMSRIRRKVLVMINNMNKIELLTRKIHLKTETVNDATRNTTSADSAAPVDSTVTDKHNPIHHIVRWFSPTKHDTK